MNERYLTKIDRFMIKYCDFMNKIYYLSVHDIVDLLLRKGHLDTRIFNQSSMQEGTRLHSLYQKEQGSDYLSEYPLAYTFHEKEFTFKVSGKADGVIISKAGSVTIEEIKTTIADLDEFIQDHGEWHLGQAMFYAFIIAKLKNLSDVSIRMVYIRQNNHNIRKFILKKYSLSELQNFVNDLIFRYAYYCRKIERMKRERDETAKSIIFPYKDYRKGQKEMIDFITNAADMKKEVFIEAPTGIGKTISVLFPFIKRFGEHNADRVIYLTSKNSIKKVAVNAMSLFTNQGIKCKTIEFTSKENICFNDKKGHCNPDECPFAKHYYDKVYDAIFDCLETSSLFNRKSIEDFCIEKQMCPFQFQLDLSKYCDVLICDYSYVYDYHDMLCLEESDIKNTKSYLCVDECHNLPSRIRDMYSIELFVSELNDALSLCGGIPFDSLKADLNDLIKVIKAIDFDSDDENVKSKHLYILEKVPQIVINDLNDCINDIKLILKKFTSLVTDSLLEFYYNLNNFSYLASLLDDDLIGHAFFCYITISNEEINTIRIINLDCRPLISQGSSYFESVIYFSATLSPKDYYIDLLGGNKEDMSNRLILDSPFPKENRLVFFNTNISLRYKDRDNTLYSVFTYIRTCVSQKKGNYFVFCPSFEYLERIYSFFQQEPLSDSEILVQSRFMKDNERTLFLESFSMESPKTTIGLLVLGGIFSEGIDLVGDRLIGAIIISVGLPQINFETNQLKEYYDKNSENMVGFNYAYTYPGINKVLQAAGRVIRSDTDKGFILYIDSRFRQPLYHNIMKEIYPDAISAISPSQVRNKLKLFWEEDDSDEF